MHTALFESHVIFILASQSVLGGAPDFESIMDLKSYAILKKWSLQWEFRGGNGSWQQLIALLSNASSTARRMAQVD